MVLKRFRTADTDAPLSVVLKHTAVVVFRTVRTRGSGLLTHLAPSCSVPFHPEAGSLEESAGFLSFHELSELMQALPGFLMLLTGEGKLLYLSDSVSEYLGHSMVGHHRIHPFATCEALLCVLSITGVCNILQVDLVAQGDSVYDIVDASDHFIMRTNLSTSTSLETGKRKMPVFISLISLFQSPDQISQTFSSPLHRPSLPLPFQHL